MSKQVRRTRELGTWKTVPNAITLIRTIAAVSMGAYALTLDDPLWWTIAGYATYYVGDMLDGLSARVLDQETRLGAIHDIISDRACTSILAANLIVIQPDLWPAIVIFLFNFMVLDCVLSLSFLHWDIISPNYFFAVDKWVYDYNWSPPAKAINNIGIIAAVAGGAVLGAWALPLALVIVIAQIAVKIVSAKVVIARAAERVGA